MAVSTPSESDLIWIKSIVGVLPDDFVERLYFNSGLKSGPDDIRDRFKQGTQFLIDKLGEGDMEAVTLQIKDVREKLNSRVAEGADAGDLMVTAWGKTLREIHGDKWDSVAEDSWNSIIAYVNPTMA